MRLEIKVVHAFYGFIPELSKYGELMLSPRGMGIASGMKKARPLGAGLLSEANRT